MRSLLLQSAPSRSPTLQGGGLRLLAASATQALVARMSSPPSASRVDAIFALILALMDAGVWSRLDLLHVMAAHNEQASRLNWIGSIYDLATYNSPTFGIDRGWLGGSTAWMDAVGYNPSTAASRLSQNDASLGLWVLTPSAGTGIDLYAGSGWMGRRNTGVDWHYRVCDGTSNFGQPGDTPGFYVGARSDPATKRLFKNGVQIVAHSVASTTPFNRLAVFGTGGGNHSTVEVAVVLAGASLTDAQHAALYAAVRTYLLTVGAIVA